MQSSLVASCLVAIIALVGCASSPGAGEAAPQRRSDQRGLLFRQITLQGQTHKYAVFIPWSYNPAKPNPTIVFLHGSGECGSDGQKQAVVGLGNNAMFRPTQYPFVIIFPQKPDQDQEWEYYDDLVMATLDATRKEFVCDASRTYLTGLSQGGHGTWTIGSLHPDVWAALAPVCSYGSPRRQPTQGVDTSDATVAAKVKHLPIWAFHGAKDDVVPMQGVQSLIAAVKAAQTQGDPEPKLTIFPDANHNAWDPAYGGENLGDWLLLHTKK